MLLLAVITKFTLRLDRIQLYTGIAVSKLKEIRIEVIINQWV